MIKCIGGPYDGKHYHLKEGQSDLNIAVYPKVLSINAFNPNEEISPIEVTYVTYTLRKLRCRNTDGSFDEIRYLAPSDWTDFKTVRHQFKK